MDLGTLKEELEAMKPICKSIFSNNSRALIEEHLSNEFLQLLWRRFMNSPSYQ